MKSKKLKVWKFKIVVNPNMESHRDDPFFTRKAEKARETLIKTGLAYMSWEELDKIFKTVK